MSRSQYNVKETYVGTGSLASYTFDFKIEELSQLLVIVYNAAGVEVKRVRGDDTTYLSSVVFDSMLGGGTVNLLANLANNYNIVILLANDAPTQPFQFSNKSSFSLKTFEMALDWAVGAIQRLAYRASLTIQLDDINNNVNPVLPGNLADNATKLVRVNDAGNGFIFGDSTAQSSAGKLPDGGAAGAALTKNSTTDGDASWDDFAISGYSNRFGAAFSSNGLRDTLIKILDLTYVGPLIASFTGSSNTLREKGASVASIVLSVNVTKRSDPIGRIRFLQGATVIADNFPPATTGSGVTTANYSTPFSDNISFTVEVTDTGVSGGPSMVSSSTSYSFVYPYYYGAGASGKTPAQVAALTKQIIASTLTVNENYTTANGDVYYFAYPAAYGNLVSILDANGFETIGSWTKTVANITGLDASAQSYNIYASNNPVVAGSTNFTFKR